MIGKSTTIPEHNEGETIVLPRSQVPEGRNEQYQEVHEISDESDDEYREVDELPVANYGAQPQSQVEQGGRELRDRTSIRPRKYKVDVAEYVVPNIYNEAMSSTDAAQWVRAVQEELQPHENNQTWLIVPRTPKQKIIDSKWVFQQGPRER